MTGSLTLACYNVEWFDGLFDRDDQLVRDDQRSARYGVNRARQADAVAEVIKAVDADALLILEAPNDGSRSGRSTVRALEHFAGVYDLRQRSVSHGFSSPTHQEIAFLFDPRSVRIWHDPLGEKLDLETARRVAPTATGETARPFPGAPRVDGVFPWDADGDGRPEFVEFSKPPLEAGLDHIATGARLRLIGLHLKSKNPGRIDDPAAREAAAIASRRKHLGQCAWIRARIDEHLSVGEPVIALGDFNDGPGMDRFERLFGQSGLEIIVGDGDGALLNPYLQQKGEVERASTTRFWRQDLGMYLEALLDFALLSPDLEAWSPEWRIWHPTNDPKIAADSSLSQALLDASDHFPVSVRLTPP